MARWRHWFSRRNWEHDLSAELRFRMDRQIAENISAGMTPEDARRNAVRELGAAEGVKATCREQRRGPWLESVGSDLGYGMRRLRKNPSFTAVSILSLALGIGLSSGRLRTGSTRNQSGSEGCASPRIELCAMPQRKIAENGRIRRSSGASISTSSARPPFPSCPAADEA